MSAAALVMVCAPVVGVCVPSYCRVLHRRFIALVQSARSFARALVATPFQWVPLLPRPKKTKRSSHLLGVLI